MNKKKRTGQALTATATRFANDPTNDTSHKASLARPLDGELMRSGGINQTTGLHRQSRVSSRVAGQNRLDRISRSELRVTLMVCQIHKIINFKILTKSLFILFCKRYC
jgi:hypothetical protein